MPRMLLAGSLTLLLVAVAQGQPAAKDPARVLEPFIGDSTIAVAVADVKGLQVDELFARLAKVGIPQDKTGPVRAMVEKGREAILAAGASHAYAVVDLGAGEEPSVLVVIPAVKADGAAALVKLVEQFPGMKAEVKGKLVLAGLGDAVTRQRHAAERPEFAEGLKAVASQSVRVVISPPDAVRGKLEQQTPNLPPPLGGGPTTSVTRGARWAATGLTLSPTLKFTWLVQAKDADAAKELARLSERVLSAAMVQTRGDAEIPPLPAEFQGLRPKAQGDRVVITLDEAAVRALVLPAVQRARAAAARAQSMNNLKQIGLAMHNYHDREGSLPPQANYGKEKKPLLSWRVHILPYLEEGHLYQQFKLDEPWDSEHNKKLIAKMPKVYQSPRQKEGTEPGKSVYLVPAGKDLMFDGPKKTKFQAITDGTSNTILAVEADDSRAVYWTQPEDHKVDPKEPKAGLVRDNQGFLALLADGSVVFISAGIEDQTLWWLFHPSDGNPILQN